VRRNLQVIGAIIVTHALFGKELIAAAEYLVGKIECIEAVSMNSQRNAFETRKTIIRAMEKVDQGEGLLLLTDFSEGSAANIAFSFLVQEKVEVITGVNLPMVLTFWNKRESHTFREVVKAVQLSGLRSIHRAKALMEIKSDKERVIARERELSSQRQ
jgi:PTS system mannose-specific IIA component